MLSTSDIRVSYSGNEVLRGLDVKVRPGEIVALLGLNGSGKTTALKAIAGVTPISAGRVHLFDENISRDSIRRRVLKGITFVPAGRTIFEDMSVADNLRLGAFIRRDHQAVERDVSYWLQRIDLVDRTHRRAGTLSGGQQRLVTVARGMMANPRFLLLDEPSVGVAPAMLGSVRALLHAVRDDLGVGSLLVEQDVPFALQTADRVILLSRGRVAIERRASDLISSNELRRMFFDL